MAREINRNTNPKTEWNRGVLALAALALVLTGSAAVIYQTDFTKADVSSPDPTPKPLEGPTRTTPYYELTRVRGDWYKAGSGTKSFDSAQLIIDLVDRGCQVDIKPYPAGGNALRTYLTATGCDPVK